MVAIETTFHGPTNTRGARITASANGHRVTISANHPTLSNSDEAVHRQAAEALRDKMGWRGELVGGGTKRGYCFVFVS